MGFFDRIFGKGKKKKEQQREQELISEINNLKEQNRDYQRVLEKSREAERAARGKLTETEKERDYAQEQVTNLSKQLYETKKERYQLDKQVKSLTEELAKAKASKPKKKLVSKPIVEEKKKKTVNPNGIFQPNFQVFVKRRHDKKR